jgi:hypothetical protein
MSRLTDVPWILLDIWHDHPFFANKGIRAYALAHSGGYAETSGSTMKGSEEEKLM